MKFILQSLGESDYQKSDVCRLEKLGFSFKKSDEIRNTGSYFYTKINNPSNLIELNSLEELIEFTNEYGDCIISDGCLTINDPDRS